MSIIHLLLRIKLRVIDLRNASATLRWRTSSVTVQHLIFLREETWRDSYSTWSRRTLFIKRNVPSVAPQGSDQSISRCLGSRPKPSSMATSLIFFYWWESHDISLKCTLLSMFRRGTSNAYTEQCSTVTSIRLLHLTHMKLHCTDPEGVVTFC